jgi:transcription-repair coupling factor
MKKFILSIKLKLFAEKHKIQRILETRNHFELYFLENAQEERAELSEKMEMKKVVKIINSTVLTEKNKKEDIADNFVIMKVKKNEFIKNL